MRTRNIKDLMIRCPNLSCSEYTTLSSETFEHFECPSCGLVFNLEGIKRQFTVICTSDENPRYVGKHYITALNKESIPTPFRIPGIKGELTVHMIFEGNIHDA